MRRGLRSTLAVLLGLAPACVGTSTGNPLPGEEPGENATGGQCDRDVETLAGLDASSALGFTGADLLALAADSGEAPIAWRAVGNGLSYGPESGEGTLRVRVSAKGTPPRFVDQRPKTRSSGGAEPAIAEVENIGEIGVQCPDLLELDVRVEVTTGGGALDETFDGVLRSSNGVVARIYKQLDADDLEGSFDAQLTSLKDAEFESVQLDLQFSKFGSAGSLGVAFAQPASAGPNAAATQTPAIAQWPAGLDCQDSRFGAKIDQQIGEFSAKAGIDRFNAAAMQLTASGASPTRLETRFTATSTTACVADLDSNDAAPSLEIDGTLSIKSADGKIDGAWPVGLRAESNAAGSLESVRVAFDLRGSIIASLVEAPAFESTYGIRGIDVSAFDQAGIVFGIEVGPTAAVSGELTVNGAKRPNCAPPEPAPTPAPGQGASSPGCPGLSFQPLWMATFSSAN